MKVLVFTGAGISRESGLRTFRGEGGLWNGQKVEDICSAMAYASHPERVIQFYNERRREVLRVDPNDAHFALAELGRDPDFDVTIVTQNIDDLHERAGSTNVIHLHGEITKKRSDRGDADGALVDCREDIQMGDLASGGGQYRPHVVFFDEMLPDGAWEKAVRASAEADVLIVIGTTLEVTPAAHIATESNARSVYLVDPRPPVDAFRRRRNRSPLRTQVIQKPATEGVADAIALLRALEIDQPSAGI